MLYPTFPFSCHSWHAGTLLLVPYQSTIRRNPWQHTQLILITGRNINERVMSGLKDPDIDAVVINTKHPQYQYQNYRETMIHELAHRIDHYEFGTLLQIQEA